MSNTLMTAKNTFGEGLIMDFAPDNTQANLLTSSLNATLLTFNGNEMSLQNDMGNGRVETARLPEGYIPIGTREFGDIIYIVSYNPLTNKSQIGCFPSPERNITSDEILNNLDQNVSWTDFQEGQNIPSGKIKNMSVKKILYNKNLNPGDQYIINVKEAGTAFINNYDNLSDFDNKSNTHGTWPKLVKIHIVSIEESGKIIFLDSDVRWYDNISSQYNYYLTALNIDASDFKPDLDSYQNLVQSAYSIFQSKVSGKLALLIELETIDSFSCTYSVVQQPSSIDKNNSNIYNTDNVIYLHTSWDSNNPDVNPNGLIVTDSKWLKDVKVIKNPDTGKETKEIKEAPCYIYKEAESNPHNYELDTTNAQFCSLPKDSAANENGFQSNSIIPISRRYEVENFNDQYKAYANRFLNPLPKYEYFRQRKSYASYSSNTNYTNILNKRDINNIIEEGKYYFDVASIKLEQDKSGNNILVYKDRNGINCNEHSITDDIINNYYHKDVIKKLTEINIPTIQKINNVEYSTDISNLVWNFSIAPTMPYGVLEHLKTNHTIDFSKLNSGIINLNGWRYYNQGTMSTLTLDLETYPEEGKGIQEVVLEFYDNMGKAAAYHITNKDSYSGTFTEFIELNVNSKNYKQNNIGADGLPFKHPGMQVDASVKDSYVEIVDNTEIHCLDDAGTLYANALYKVLITVKYCPKDSLGKYIVDDTSNYKYFSRWFYTFGIFNDQYYNVKDFNSLQPQVTLDGNIEFLGKDLTLNQLWYKNEELKTNENTDPAQTIGANIWYINQNGAADKEGNLNIKIKHGLIEDYGVFNLKQDQLVNIIDTISLGESKINCDKYTQRSEEEIAPNISIQPQLNSDLNSYKNKYNLTGYISNYKNLISPNLAKLLNIKDVYNGKDLWELDDSLSENNYLNYKDQFSINFSTKYDQSIIYIHTEDLEKCLNYKDYNDKEVSLKDYVSYTLNASQLEDVGVDLTLTGIYYNKYIYSNINRIEDVRQVKSIINQTDIASYGLQLGSESSLERHMYFDSLQTFGLGESKNHSTRWAAAYFSNLQPGRWQSENITEITGDGHDAWGPKVEDPVIQDLFKNVPEYIIPLGLCKPTSENGYAGKMWINRDQTKFRNYYEHADSYYKNAPKDELYVNSNIPKFSSPEATDSQRYPFMINLLCFRDPETNLVNIINDPFYTDTYNSNDKQQSYFAGTDLPGGISSITLQADLLGGIYAQLYSTINDTTEIWNPDNFTYLSDFNEYWNKDIIIESSVQKDKDPNKLLLFHEYPISEYISNINSKFPKSVISEQNNVIFKINSFQKVTVFQYSFPYNINKIKLLAEDNSLKTSFVNVIYYKNGTECTKLYKGQVNDNILYTLTDDEIIKFSSDSTLKDVKGWQGTNKKLSPIYVNDLPGTYDTRSLSDMFYVENGYLRIHNYSKFIGYNNKFSIYWKGGGHDHPKLRDIPGASILNKFKL